MNKPAPKNTDENDTREDSASRRTSSETVPHAPGGPGWISEHSLILWIVGISLVVAAFAIYMVFDNR